MTADDDDILGDEINYEFADDECGNCGKPLGEDDYDELCFACFVYFHNDVA